MANLTRYDPFDLARNGPFGDFSDLFKGVFVRPAMLEDMPEIQIKMDLQEDEQAYLVHADIPGVKKDDIQVDIDGNQISISVEARMEKESREGGKMLRAERYRGRAARSFTLAHDVDEAQAEARYTDGVLTLKLPKKTTSTARKLAIQ